MSKNFGRAFIFYLIWFSLCSLCFQKAINCGLMWANWSNDDVIIEYFGEYELQVVKNARNTTYEFLLDNGDRIRIPSEYVENREQLKSLADSNKLTFCYFPYLAILDFGGHYPISITGENGGVRYVDETKVVSGAKIGTILFSVLGFACASVVLSVAVIDLIVKRQHYKRCVLNWIRKLKKRFKK